MATSDDKLEALAIGQAVTNEKLSNIEYLLKKHIDMDEATFKAHDDRIKNNERQHWYTRGVSAVLVVMGTMLARKYF